MKTKFNRIMSVIFCLAMLLVFCTVAFAAPAGLSVSLDSTAAEVGSLPSTVSMTVGTTEPLSIMSFWGEAYSNDSRITISAIQGSNLSASADTGRFAFMTMTETSVSNWATVVFSIPADLPVGTYTLGVRSVGASKSDNSNPLSGVSGQTVTFTVNDVAPKPSKTITEDDITVEAVTYTGSALTPAVTVNGLAPSDFTMVYDNNINAGSTASVIIMPTEDGRYVFEPVTKYFTIDKAVITITAKDHAIVVGEAAPELGEDDYTVEGLLGDDAMVTEPTIAYVSRPDTGKVGTCEIVVSGAVASDNYTIVYVNGTLTVVANESDLPVIPNIPAVDEKCDGGVTCPAFGFSDVDHSKWYHEGIDFVVANGMMNGTGANKFDPHGVTSRAMIVTILYRLEGQPAISGANPFSDVNNGTWYSDAVVWAAANGIVGGYGDGKFGPNDAITREQLAKIMYNYAEYKGYDVSARASMASFSDAGKVSSWATKEMQWAVSVGLINGMGDGRVAPQGGAERCQVAAIFMRFCDKYVEE